jgi:DNA polymerase-1
MGAAGLREYAFTSFDLDMTLRQAEEALRAFFRPFPRLEAWRSTHADLCRRRGYIEIGAGRVVRSEWEPFGLSFQQTCNLPIQGACADVMLRALRLVHRRLRQARLRGGLVASVHDELLLEVHADDAEIARDLLEDAMIGAFIETFPGAPVNGVAAAKVGRTWAEVK